MGWFLDRPEDTVFSIEFGVYLSLTQAKRCACYALVNKKTGEFYVGSTRSINDRVASHKNMLRTNTHSNRFLQADYNKFKDENNYVFKIAIYPDYELAADREQEILNEGFHSGVLFNIANGARMSDRTRTEKYAKPKYTEESKREQKIRASKTGVSNWENPELRRKMINSMGENITVDGVSYGSVREASRELKISILTIRNRLVGGVASLSDLKPLRRAVICEGFRYLSVSEAAKAYGIKANTMVVRLKSKNEIWKNFNYDD